MKRLLALLVLLLGCHGDDPPPPPPPAPLPPIQASSSRVSGLQATVSRVAQAPGTGRMELTYLLEWYAAPTSEVTQDGRIQIYNVWLLRGLEPVTIRFWGAPGAPPVEVGERVVLPEAFLRRTAPSHELHLLVDPPAGARSVSIALGNSGLESERERLP